MSALEAQPRQCISNIYIYLYVSYQSVYTGFEVRPKDKYALFQVMSSKNLGSVDRQTFL